MSDPFNIYDWYWQVQDTSPGTQRYSSKVNAFVATSDSAYIAWVGRGNTATVIDTMAHLNQTLNIASVTTFLPASFIATATADVTLTNPLASSTQITVNASGKKVFLPIMNAPNSIGLGNEFEISNDYNSLYSIDLYYQDTTSVIGTIGVGDSIKMFLIDNSSKNGQVFYRYHRILDSTNAAQGRGFQVKNNTTTPNTKMDITVRDPVLTDFKGNTRKFQGAISVTIDLSLAGPVLNGRDQSAAFSASTQLHFYLIGQYSGTNFGGIVSLNDPNVLTGPNLPSGYQLWMYVASAFYNGIPQLETIDIGNGSIPCNIWAGAINARGWTMRPKANELLIGVGSDQDAKFQTIDSLASKASPTGSDYLLVSDQAASGALKRASFPTGVAGAISQVKIVVFNASGTYNPTAGMKYCIAEAVGGGGAGGGVTGTSSTIVGAAGGGSGAYARRLLTAAQIGASQTVTIGPGGTGVSGSSGTGNSGSDTSLGTLVVAKGGIGGPGSAIAFAGGPGGSGPSSTGDVTASGTPGLFATQLATAGPQYCASGPGGSSFFGGGGVAAYVGSGAAIAGNAGTSGGGGSGAHANATTSSAAGGPGGTGYMVITEFI